MAFEKQQQFFLKKSPVGFGNQWEKNVYHGVTEYLNRGVQGYVHHLIKPTFSTRRHGRVSRAQVIDILVDNADGYNFGIECKASKQTSLRISTWFRHNGKGNQFETESEFLSRANRIGILAMVMADTRSYGEYFIPWNMVLVLWGRTITTAVLDGYVTDNLIYKLPSGNGMVWLPPQDTDIFRRIAEMNKKAEKLVNDEKQRAECPKMPRAKKG